MSYYLKTGNTYRVTSKEAMDLHDKLPGGNFVLRQTPNGELYLAKIDSFQLSGKIYGKIEQQSQRVLHTFGDRAGSTGVLLAGEKGSGKTLLAKHICARAEQDGVPTIVINAPWRGDVFNSFIQQITQPCIILFDEFEKVYDQPKQQEILTLLDGVFPSKKMFIITVNNKYGVDFHMRNRPGRIYYLLDFKGLDNPFIVEYCQDNLKDKTQTDRICKIATIFDTFNFDMLKAIVEEMNRFDETPQEVLAVLNTKPEFSVATVYDVNINVDGIEIKPDVMHDKTWKGNPIFSPVMVHYEEEVIPRTPEDEDSITRTVAVTPNDLKQIDTDAGKFIFKTADGKQVVLTKQRSVSYNYYGSLD
jgi:hypothetical protein